MLALDHFESADAAADVYTDTFGFVRIYNLLEAGTLHRKIRRRDGELDKAAHLLDFFFLDVIRRVETLHLTGNSAIEIGGIKGRNGCDTIRTFLDGLPDGFRADAYRGHKTDTGNNNSSLQAGLQLD